MPISKLLTLQELFCVNQVPIESIKNDVFDSFYVLVPRIDTAYRVSAESVRELTAFQDVMTMAEIIELVHIWRGDPVNEVGVGYSLKL